MIGRPAHDDSPDHVGHWIGRGVIVFSGLLLTCTLGPVALLLLIELARLLRI